MRGVARNSASHRPLAALLRGLGSQPGLPCILHSFETRHGASISTESGASGPLEGIKVQFSPFDLHHDSENLHRIVSRNLRHAASSTEANESMTPVHRASYIKHIEPRLRCVAKSCTRSSTRTLVPTETTDGNPAEYGKTKDEHDRKLQSPIWNR